MSNLLAWSVNVASVTAPRRYLAADPLLVGRAVGETHRLKRADARAHSGKATPCLSLSRCTCVGSFDSFRLRKFKTHSSRAPSPPRQRLPSNALIESATPPPVRSTFHPGRFR